MPSSFVAELSERFKGLKTSPGKEKSMKRSQQPMTAQPTARPDLISEFDNARVYQTYPLSSPPPHPGDGWTRFVCISDTHGKTPELPPGDVLIHAGDISRFSHAWKGFQTSIEHVLNAPYPSKIIIAGNHDHHLDLHVHGEAEPRERELYQQAQDILKGPNARAGGMEYLEFESTKVSSVPWVVFGSPGSPIHLGGAFQYFDNRAKEINARIPTDTQILVTHTPPLGILDMQRHGRECGCPALTTRLFGSSEPPYEEPNSKFIHLPAGSAPPPPPPPRTTNTNTTADEGKRKRTPSEIEADRNWLPNVCLHVFGHIHESWGARIITRDPPSEEEEEEADGSLPPSYSTSSSPSSTPIAIPNAAASSTGTAKPSSSRRMPIETVFVNAAVDKSGTQAIIVDLRNIPIGASAE